MCIRDRAAIDLQPEALYLVEGDTVQLNCSVASSANVTCPVSPLNLTDVIIRRRSSNATYMGRVQIIEDNVAQVTLDTRARFSDGGNVYCSILDVTGNTIVDSPSTHIYVFSQYI